MALSLMLEEPEDCGHVIKPAQHVRITDDEWARLRHQYAEHHDIEDDETQPDGLGDYLMCVCDDCTYFRAWFATTMWAQWEAARYEERRMAGVKDLAMSFVQHMQSGGDPHDWIAQQRSKGHDVSGLEKQLEPVSAPPAPGMYL